MMVEIRILWQLSCHNNSPWASPSLITPKKIKDTRRVINFWKNEWGNKMTSVSYTSNNCNITKVGLVQFCNSILHIVGILYYPTRWRKDMKTPTEDIVEKEIKRHTIHQQKTFQTSDLKNYFWVSYGKMIGSLMNALNVIQLNTQIRR